MQECGSDWRWLQRIHECIGKSSLSWDFSPKILADGAQGRVLHTCFVFPRSTNSYLISHESPDTHPAPLQTLLPPYKLRSKVRIKDVSEEWEAWSTWGGDLGASGTLPKRVWRPGSGGANESQWSWPDGVRDVGVSDEEVGCWDLRAGLNMRQLLVPKGERREISTLPAL